jgi:hypothetical protein
MEVGIKSRLSAGMYFFKKVAIARKSEIKRKSVTLSQVDAIYASYAFIVVFFIGKDAAFSSRAAVHL